MKLKRDEDKVDEKVKDLQEQIDELKSPTVGDTGLGGGEEETEFVPSPDGYYDGKAWAPVHDDVGINDGEESLSIPDDGGAFVGNGDDEEDFGFCPKPWQRTNAVEDHESFDAAQAEENDQEEEEQ